MSKRVFSDDIILIGEPRVVECRIMLVERMCEIMNQSKHKINLADYSHGKIKTTM